MKTLLAVVATSLSGSYAHAEPVQPDIIGTWQSSAERTLRSMNEVTGIDAATRAALSEDYYGHLIVEYRDDTVRAHFDNRDYDSGYRPYRLVEATNDYVVTLEWNEILLAFEETTTYFDPPCIYGINDTWGYREYYCPAAD